MLYKSIACPLEFHVQVLGVRTHVCSVPRVRGDRIDTYCIFRVRFAPVKLPGVPPSLAILTLSAITLYQTITRESDLQLANYTSGHIVYRPVQMTNKGRKDPFERSEKYNTGGQYNTIKLGVS